MDGGYRCCRRHVTPPFSVSDSQRSPRLLARQRSTGDRCAIAGLPAPPGRRCGRQGQQVRPRPAGRVPLGARDRRRHPHRGRDRRARRGQGAADPAARPVGGGGLGAAASRAGVPNTQTHRTHDRGRNPHLAASHPDDIDTPLDVVSVRADGWLGELRASPRRCAPTSNAGCRD
jgi:hypothetical protein